MMRTGTIHGAFQRVRRVGEFGNRRIIVAVGSKQENKMAMAIEDQEAVGSEKFRQLLLTTFTSFIKTEVRDSRLEIRTNHWL
jgi:hypothetical protein